MCKIGSIDESMALFYFIDTHLKISFLMYIVTYTFCSIVLYYRGKRLICDAA